MLQLLRPKQWTKNLLVFAALVFAERLFDPTAVVTACLAFLAFCLASSSVYVVNDLVDRERDRLHPEKQRRPLASGAVSPAAAALLALALAAGGLSLAFSLRPGFGVAVVVYMGLSHFYSLVGKNVVILDILLIAAGFVLRAIAGALAIDVPYSDWFVLCTLFVALFVALSKRKAELVAASGGAEARPVLARYDEASLRAFTVASMTAAILSYSLYVQDVLEGAGGGMRLLLFTVPFVVLAVFRYHLLVEREGAGERPEDTLLTDRPLQLSILGFVLVAMAAFYGGR